MVELVRRAELSDVGVHARSSPRPRPERRGAELDVVGVE